MKNRKAEKKGTFTTNNNVGDAKCGDDFSQKTAREMYVCQGLNWISQESKSSTLSIHRLFIKFSKFI
jgi:hypothetical protein